MFETGPNQAKAATLIEEDTTLAQQAAQDVAIKLYRCYVNRVYRYLLIRLGSTADAQKLTTQVFQLAYKQIARYQGDEAFAAWLLGIARRKLGNYMQHEYPLALTAAKPSTHLDNFTLALAELPADYADALTLRIFARLNTTQVAQVIGNSETEVKLMIRQALRDLQERLAFVQEAQEWIEIEIKL